MGNIASFISDSFLLANEYILSISGGNQMISAAIVVWALGTFTYIMRSLPSSIYNIFMRYQTTEIVLTSANSSFYELVSWLQKEGYSNKFRNVKIHNGQYGGEKSIKSLGYGFGIIWYKRRPLYIRLESLESRDANKDKEKFTIIKLGRSHKLIDDFIRDVSFCNNEFEKIKIYNQSGRDYDFICNAPKRPFSSIYIRSDIEKNIIDTLDRFVKSEEWYNNHGIPYHLGIMLYGPPGTGKTSLIKAIASYLGRDIFICETSAIANINHIEDNTILVIEDIDTNNTVKKRNIVEPDNDDNKLLELKRAKSGSTLGKAKKDPLQSGIESLLSDKGGLAHLLNIMDGIMSKHGSVIVLTTNNIGSIDPAIFRPGRIDLLVHVDYLNMEVFEKFIKAFYTDCSLDFSKYKLKSSILTGAMLQQDVMCKLSLNQIIEKHLEEVKK